LKKDVRNKTFGKIQVRDVLTIRIFKGKDGRVIGRLFYGKVVLFNKKNIYLNEPGLKQVN